MKTIDFLFRHLNDHNTPEEWNALLGVNIIDADGWRGTLDLPPQDYYKPIPLGEYVKRLASSTIE